MKYMLIMRATDEGVAAFKDKPFDEVIAEMGRYNESMIEAGVLAGGDGLTDAAEGFVVHFADSPPRIVEGAYGATEALFNGYWVLDVATREEAAEWASRAPLGPGAFLEVRRITDASDFPADNEWVEKEAEWRAAGEQS